MANACIPKHLIEKYKQKALKGEITADDIAKMLPEDKAAVKAILEDFVSEKIGIKVSSAEVKAISEKAKAIETAQKKLGNDLGNPSKPKENIEFFKAKKKMDDYLASRAPSSRLRVATGTLGRGMMLFSAKSPILNIASNVEIGFMEALTRRVTNFGVKSTNNALALDYVKMANKIYQESGYDISRMMTIDDFGTNGQRVLGDTVTTQGQGKVRAASRVVEDIVFKQLMGAPDVAFASAHFADSVNLNAYKLAKGDKVKATEFMNDAMRLEPTTAEGKILKAQGVMDAQKATWTDTSWASRVSGGIRKILNDVSGDLRAGDYLLPFVKTPANVVATGMDYAGMGIPKALIKTVKAWRSGELGTKEHWQSINRDLVRSGLGITGAIIIQNQLKDEDFVGAYDPARAQIESLRNSNYNAIRVGGKWISTDWLGPLAVPVTAMMYARKYGDTGGERTFQYAKGVLASSLNIPGVSDIYDSVKSQAFKKNQSLDEMVGEATNYITEQIYSRLIPSIVADTAKTIDPYARNTKDKTFGVIPNSIVAKVPFASQTLPAKTNIFGEPVRNESALSTILFGSRIKTDKENAITKEIMRVSDSLDKSVNFTDWDKSANKTLAQFKDKVGNEVFNKAKIDYGKLLKSELAKTINKPEYQDLSDDEKLSVINGKDAEVMSSIFKKYEFTYKKAPPKRKIKI